jgi:phenylalanine-4-hydroxylase
MGGPALVAAEPYLIKQDYEHYTPEQHAVWTELVRRRLPQVEEYACQVFGHVPMHSHPVFAGFLQHYGSVCAQIEHKLVLERLGRLFWYTVEFGIMRRGGKIKVYGSGVISSHGECTNVIQGGCTVRPFDLETVLETPVKVDELQKVLFAIESFEQIYEAMQEAERRVSLSF